MADDTQRALASLRDSIIDLTIVQLALAGVGNREIAKVVGVNKTRIANIAKYARTGNKEKA